VRKGISSLLKVLEWLRAVELKVNICCAILVAELVGLSVDFAD
jgi:hypothetical protein